MNETGGSLRRGNRSREYRAANGAPLGLKQGQGLRAAVDAAVRRMEAQGRLPRLARDISLNQGVRK